MTTNWADLFDRAETVNIDLETIRETLEAQRRDAGPDDSETQSAGDEVRQDG
ncbi:hypothetical protein HALLA_17705 [Halostagnicola larsenii XH-48]|uniref:Uncharacterized protein n=1 Tax=Halostagnicola larsenii XH-48 TaxID=797299 RepID=W0JUV4_9EURY|nr:hypothetical protein [Halostagnicola larsenii]AHG01137.1 hypothetical protein HALLA_17705 [Halostagnicola larsenii XH-48]